MSLFREIACRLFLALILFAGFNVVRGAEVLKQGMAEVNGTRLYYEVAGRGFPLVLISGGGNLDRRAWDEQFETFAKHYRVIRYDIRGLGKSARPTATFSHSRDLHELLKFLKIKKAHILGLSFGGGIAIDFALDYPDMVDRLILAATGLSSDAKGEANLQGIMALTSMAKKEGIERAVEFILSLPSIISAGNRTARERVRQIYLDNRDVFETGFPLVTLWQPVEPPATVERLSEIGARTLVIIPENDHPFYKAITEKLASGIKGAKVVTIPGGTHIVNLEKPVEFNQAVLQFLMEK